MNDALGRCPFLSTGQRVTDGADADSEIVRGTGTAGRGDEAVIHADGQCWYGRFKHTFMRHAEEESRGEGTHYDDL